ncbi:MAG: hypothetical protein U5R30_15800 [Deltaproteobacteria bacterium]|nr:hypothetical protein [Deltaproteobacteria bacterium]
MTAGHAVARLAVDGVVFHQHDRPGLIEFVELHLAGEHVGDRQLLALVGAIQQPHGEELGLGLDDQVLAHMAVVHGGDQAPGMQPAGRPWNACQIEKGQPDADAGNHQCKKPFAAQCRH